MESRTGAVRRRQNACSCCGQALKLRHPERPFRLTDGMVLLGVSALAFLAIRPLFEGSHQLSHLWQQAIASWVAVLVFWSPTLVLLRLRRPRPPVSRLMRTPGFVACVTASVMVALGVLSFGLVAIDRADRYAEKQRLREEQERQQHESVSVYTSSSPSLPVPTPPLPSTSTTQGMTFLGDGSKTSFLPSTSTSQGMTFLADTSGTPVSSASETAPVPVPVPVEPAGSMVLVEKPKPIVTMWTNPSWWLNIGLFFGVFAGTSVLGGWIVLALSGRRRPSSNWFDVLGRFVGGSWIAVFLIYACWRVALWMG